MLHRLGRFPGKAANRIPLLRGRHEASGSPRRLRGEQERGGRVESRSEEGGKGRGRGTGEGVWGNLARVGVLARVCGRWRLL